jgi:hypothetical protein
MTSHQSAPSAADLDAARLLLSRLGVSLTDLLAASQDRVPAPTFAEYIPVVSTAVADGTRRVYGSYWNRVLQNWGTRRLDEPHLQKLTNWLNTPKPTPSLVATLVGGAVRQKGLLRCAKPGQARSIHSGWSERQGQLVEGSHDP